VCRLVQGETVWQRVVCAGTRECDRVSVCVRQSGLGAMGERVERVAV